MYTYIIIDDEELIRKGTLKKISPISDQVACIGEAEEGASGIRLISELHPNFVILDMQMPGIDGMELLPYLAEHYPHMPLIVISGYKNFDYIKQAISSNAIEYLLKPFSREAIQEVIFKAVERLQDRSQIHDKIAASEKEKEQACYDYDIQLLNNLILGYPVGDLKMTSQKLSYINAPHKSPCRTGSLSMISAIRCCTWPALSTSIWHLSWSLCRTAPRSPMNRSPAGSWTPFSPC